jgi:hypothetical protein
MAEGEDALLRDATLMAQLETLKGDIIRWATERELWHDAGFKVPFLHRNEPPREGEVLYMWFEGPFHSMFSGGHHEWDALEEDFRAMLGAAGYEYELEDHVSLNIFPKADDAKKDYLRLQRWQWIQFLAERRLYDLHAEVFEHFAQNSETLKNLHWRQFEEILDSIFRNQGFRTELGSGGNDGGVDIRLYQSDSIPEIVTLVQAKKYVGMPIKLEAVAALTGIAQMERASHALFATTSRYQPRARQFARNTQGRVDLPTLELVDSERIQEWCASLSKQLSNYFRTGEQGVPPIVLARRPTDLIGRIVVASWGYNTTWNTFAVIEADYPHEVILRTIGHRDVSGDGHYGTQVPDDNAPSRMEPPRILAFKTQSELVGVSFWGDRKLFVLWDGTPRHFDLRD